jgi:hypothetical protein
MISIRDLECDRRGHDFKSRKNRVFRSVFQGNDCVVKEYSGEFPGGPATEESVLIECAKAGVRVPRLLAHIENAIVMEFIEGDNVADVFDEACDRATAPDPSNELNAMGNALARWLWEFHGAFSHHRIRGDGILRNFIIDSSGIVGLDFEESSEGDPIDDLGFLISNILMTDPPFTELKLSFARHVARCYWGFAGRDRSSDLPIAVSRGIQHYAKYRSNVRELTDKAILVENGKISLK